jgi:ATP-binding cassette subfamily B protein
MSTDFYEEEDFVTRFTGKTFLRIGKQLLPHWKWALTFFIAILIVAGMDAVFTFLSKQAIDLGIVPKDVQVMVYYYSIYGILILVQSVFVFGLIYAAGMLGERIRYDLRKGMFNHLQDLSLSYFSRTPVGWICPGLHPTPKESRIWSHGDLWIQVGL